MLHYNSNFPRLVLTMKKLIIQIPCFNEGETLGETLSHLPRAVPGIECVEWLIINDGSADNTIDVARENGVDHIVSLPHHQGLSAAFSAGIEACLKAGADIIVNTDGDNQYDASAIPDLIQPILDGDAQIVIGERPIMRINEFSFIKKLLQRLGSYVVRMASDTSVPDATSGFRAMHREAALRMCVFNPYTYTLETIIQAGRKNVPIASVKIQSNAATRPSRLITSTSSYIRRSLGTIFRIFVLYKPLRSFFIVGTILLVPGILIGIRFLTKFLAGDGSGNVQSLILASILIVTSVIVFVAGMLADLVAANRQLLEEVRMRLLRSEVSNRESNPKD